jgi:hypothetical protein
MLNPRHRVLALSGALTYTFAVAAHFVVHAVGAGAEFFFTSVGHAAMLLGVFGAGLIAARALGIGANPNEVRRRAALLAAWAEARPVPLIVHLVVQGLLVVGLLVAESASIAPERLIEAVLCGAVAVLFSAFAVRALRVLLPRTLAALHAGHVDREARAVRLAGEPLFAGPFHFSVRSRPVRAPPAR